MTAAVQDSFLIGETIYIVGHKKPDLDAIVSAYGYQVYRHSQGDFNYLAVRCGEPNEVTKWAFERFGIEMPALVKNISGKKVALVDHTDPEQRPDGWEDAEILEVVDHHKLKLETTAPPKITIRPYGSTATLVTRRLLERNVHISPEVAGLLLAAVIDDTLALRSPITTYIDKVMAGRLATLSSIEDLGAFARELFEVKDVWGKISVEKIVNGDMKIFEMGGLKVQITQVETTDNKKLVDTRGKEFREYLDSAVKDSDADLMIMLVTDLLRNDCLLLASGERVEELEKVFEGKFADGVMHLPGVVSRKKQVVPPLLEYFK